MYERYLENCWEEHTTPLDWLEWITMLDDEVLIGNRALKEQD